MFHNHSLIRSHILNRPNPLKTTSAPLEAERAHALELKDTLLPPLSPPCSLVSSLLSAPPHLPPSLSPLGEAAIKQPVCSPAGTQTAAGGIVVDDGDIWAGCYATQSLTVARKLSN